MKVKLRDDPVVATAPNECWQMDFLSDQLFDGGKFRVLSIVSRPGKPTDNAFVESYNGRVRAECLNTNWFLSPADAQAKCATWRRDYNEVRPQSSIGNQTPLERAFASGQAGMP